MNYEPRDIEPKWQQEWQKRNAYKVEEKEGQPKFYALDMFPYPSGAGLHVGHPLGYIASDIYARYKRLKGFNVLHPMGFDSFGLPAEQYAIQTGQHPAITTRENIARYKEQLGKIGFCYDWEREVQTSDPNYYRWTQWIFLQLFDSWYNKVSDKAERIHTLVEHFEKHGSNGVNAPCDEHTSFSAEEWKEWSEVQQQEMLLNYRLAYLSESWVNWCPALGTVLANDEVKDGFSERGGHPVEQKLMKQWSMRITAYAERLLQGLETIDWSDALKEQQRNWIGKSNGAMVRFALTPSPSPRERGAHGFETWDKENASNLINNAKENRKNATEAEELLWQELRNHKLGVKFRRQHPVDNFIPDFVCLKEKLIIEVDGSVHDEPEQQQKDVERDRILNEQGYRVLRFRNNDVLSSVSNVIAEIQKALSLGEGLGEAKSEINSQGKYIEVFTTRPDTIFGVSFMTLAPEHPLVNEITTNEQREAVEAYVEKAGRKTERERQANVKEISGCFTGAYAEHPFTGNSIPIWIGEYVLASYGTGAVMAVPAGDQRDWDFARHFNIEIPNIFDGADISESAYTDKEIPLKDSDFLNGMKGQEAIVKAIAAIEAEGIGQGKVNYRLRDAVFGRQRYWGEPIPIYYKDGVPMALPDEELPLNLPEVDKYLPTEDGEPPLARATDWKYKGQYDFEHTTMPGWAGSSWYFLRYMDPTNETAFADPEKMKYWNQVDLYIGGSEHATGHLLYSRFWTKFLKDRGYIEFDEPFKKLINQGMIQGNSRFVYRVSTKTPSNKQVFVCRRILEDIFGDISKGNVKITNETANALIDVIRQRLPEFQLEENEEPRTQVSIGELHVDIHFVEGLTLDQVKFRSWRNGEYADAVFITGETNEYICGAETEKMSKSKFNVQTPDDLVEEYGADTLRCYEMFLGPLEQSKPWDTQGINGVNNFLRKLWRLFHDGESFSVSDEPASKDAMKVLHKHIKKVEDDLQRYSFNTVVSQSMIAVNELNDLKCNNRDVLEPLLITIAPYAPHICEELWSKLGHEDLIIDQSFPEVQAEYLVDDEIEYPVQFNGKKRFDIKVPAEAGKDEVEQLVLASEQAAKYLDGKTPKKVIVVPKRIVNVVV